MKKPLLILLVVGGVILGGIAIVVGFGVLLVATAKDLPVTEADKSLFIRAHDLLPYFEDYAPDEKYEVMTKQRYFDQSVELSYEYDSPIDDDPYIIASVTTAKTRSEANSNFSIEWSAQQLGLNIADGEIDLQEVNTFYSCGDRSRFAHITYQGNSVGHLLVAQKGNYVYAFTITGFLLEDPVMWHELVDERIANLGKNGHP